MTEKTVWVIEKEGGAWSVFLKKFFEDVPVRFEQYSERNGALGAFDKSLPAMVFAEPSFLSLPFIQKFKVRKQTDPGFRLYLLGGPASGKRDPLFDAVFAARPDPGEFARKWSETLTMSERVSVLVIDDEDEIARLIRDYFEGRTAPAFEVRHASNGREGLEAIGRERPDLIILDVKMPGMDGREFYAELRRRKLEIPVVVFFDSISGEELTAIRKHGNPPVVEKGVAAGSLPALMLLVKKMIFFGEIR